MTIQRITRVTLSQLRSGFCSRLKDFQFRIGKTQDDLCPQCWYFPQNVDHLFNCPARPTQLVTDDLWTFPEEVASFLSFHPSFDVPPPPPPPPQRRRRGRPPPAPPPSPAPAPNFTLFSPLSIPSPVSFDLTASFSTLSLDTSIP